MSHIENNKKIYLQLTGRALRPVKNKKQSIVIDLIGNTFIPIKWTLK
jgi:superfamily II DNA or RNA helicase